MPEAYPIRITTRKTKLFPFVLPEVKLLRIDAGQAMPKHMSISPSNIFTMDISNRSFPVSTQTEAASLRETAL